VTGAGGRAGEPEEREAAGPEDREAAESEARKPAPFRTASVVMTESVMVLR
jgi:hypothetical protein